MNISKQCHLSELGLELITVISIYLQLQPSSSPAYAGTNLNEQPWNKLPDREKGLPLWEIKNKNKTKQIIFNIQYSSIQKSQNTIKYITNMKQEECVAQNQGSQ